MGVSCKSFLESINRTQSVFLDGASGREHTHQCRKHKRLGFDPWVRKISWMRTQQPIPALLPEESHGQRSLEGYSPQSPKESDRTERLSTQQTECSHGCLISSPFYRPSLVHNLAMKQQQVERKDKCFQSLCVCLVTKSCLILLRPHGL